MRTGTGPAAAPGTRSLRYLKVRQGRHQLVQLPGGTGSGDPGLLLSGRVQVVMATRRTETHTRTCTHINLTCVNSSSASVPGIRDLVHLGGGTELSSWSSRFSTAGRASSPLPPFLTGFSWGGGVTDASGPPFS